MKKAERFEFHELIGYLYTDQAIYGNLRYSIELYDGDELVLREATDRDHEFLGKLPCGHVFEVVRDDLPIEVYNPLRVTIAGRATATSE